MKQKAWQDLADRRRKLHSFRGLVALAESGDREAAKFLLDHIYFLIGDAKKTLWPNELRSYVMHALNSVAHDGQSLDKAFNLTKDRRGRARAMDTELRDSQLARRVHFLFQETGNLTAAQHKVADEWKPFPPGSGCVGFETVKKAYQRYYGKEIED